MAAISRQAFNGNERANGEFGAEPGGLKGSGVEKAVGHPRRTGVKFRLGALRRGIFGSKLDELLEGALPVYTKNLVSPKARLRAAPSQGESPG